MGSAAETPCTCRTLGRTQAGRPAWATISTSDWRRRCRGATVATALSVCNWATGTVKDDEPAAVMPAPVALCVTTGRLPRCAALAGVACTVTPSATTVETNIAATPAGSSCRTLLRTGAPLGLRAYSTTFLAHFGTT